MIRDEKGQSLVEVALVIPILLLILVGIFDLGKVLYSYSALHFTAQESVRVGSFGNEDEKIIEFAKNNFKGGDSTILQVEISPSEEVRKSGEYVTVTLRYPVELMIPVVKSVFADDILLSSSSTIRIE